jgi:hypothetical protein
MATENYEYVAELTLDNKTGLYNLFITTYNGSSVELIPILVEKRYDMRMDLLVNELMGSTRYVGTVCQINNILNPFALKSGDIIFYVSTDEAESLLVVPDIIRESGVDSLLSQVKSDLINALKNRQQDPNRRNFLDKRGGDNLPPTVLDSPTPQIVATAERIKIAPDLFQTPRTTTISQTEIDQTEADDNLERVLVRRYIKLIN